MVEYLYGVDTNDSNFNSVEKTGGSNTHKHNNGTSGAPSNNISGVPSNNTSGSTALTVNQIPSHNHTVYGRIDRHQGNGEIFRELTEQEGSTNNVVTTNTGGGQGHTHTLSSHTHTLNNHTHTIAEGSNIQKYITCYMWKRTA